MGTSGFEKPLALEGYKGSMTDIRAHLDKIRSDAAECILISSLAPDGKGEVFARTAEHLNGLALEIEKTIAANTADNGKRGESVHVARPADHKEAVAAEYGCRASSTGRATAPNGSMVVGYRFRWHCRNILVGEYAGEYSSLFSALQPKHETSQAPQHNTIQAISTFLSVEQADRKILTEQLSVLTARLDNLATALDNHKTAGAEIVAPSNKETVGAAERRPAEAKPAPDVKQPATSEENRTTARESPPTAKQSHGVPSAADSPQIESVDRVGQFQFLQEIRANSARRAARSSVRSIRYPAHTRLWMGGGASAGSKSGLGPDQSKPSTLLTRASPSRYSQPSIAIDTVAAYASLLNLAVR